VLATNLHTLQKQTSIWPSMQLPRTIWSTPLNCFLCCNKYPVLYLCFQPV